MRALRIVRRVATLMMTIVSIAMLVGCASRPINPPITHADSSAGYRFEVRRSQARGKETVFILAFSGGGTRAAAFSYGVLEFLHHTRFVSADGRTVHPLEAVDLIIGVSGGSFTALAYGLSGEKLFDGYESAFLKRDVQGALIRRALNPFNWPKLWSRDFGRSELAAELYDEILFHGATFGDLDRGNGPMIVASATDLSTGQRFEFNQGIFDIICSDLGAVPLSRAAAASSAVPVVLSPVTLTNYGGKCGMQPPPWTQPFLEMPRVSRPAARALRTFEAAMALGDSANRPYLHLVDGGVADNLGLRTVLDAIQATQALQVAGYRSPLEDARKVAIIVVDSHSAPPTNWDKSAAPPGIVATMLKAAGTPIAHNSYEMIEQLKDISDEWHRLRLLAQSGAVASNTDPAIVAALRVPNADLYAIEVSFAQLEDKAEFEYLNALPTTFVLPEEAVDRLRAAAGKIILKSPEFNRLLDDLGAHVVTETVAP